MKGWDEMSDPWKSELELSTEAASNLIAAQFPQLTPIHTILLGQGFDNTVFMINHQYVFRFPRRAIAAHLLLTENKLLPQMTKVLNLSIPEPIFFGSPSEQYPWSFTGYKKVSGVTPSVMSETQRLESAAPLAKFLQTLHQYPIEKAKALDVPYDQMNRLGIKARIGKLEENVLRAIADGLLKNTEVILEYLTHLKTVEVGAEHVLVHGDLHFRNILVNADNHLSGIIDWGDVHIGHLAVDLSFVYSFLPPEGRRQFFKIYGQVDEKTKYLARFKAVYTSVILVRYAHDQKNHEFVEAALQALHLALSD
jgi:aminoglycoside phosphotransferase (APT) family kinase protein